MNARDSIAALQSLLALKKGDDYATTISWIRAKVSFSILRSALLRGTRRKRRVANMSDIDITSESAQARILVLTFLSVETSFRFIYFLFDSSLNFSSFIVFNQNKWSYMIM